MAAITDIPFETILGELNAISIPGLHTTLKKTVTELMGRGSSLSTAYQIPVKIYSISSEISYLLVRQERGAVFQRVSGLRTFVGCVKIVVDHGGMEDSRISEAINGAFFEVSMATRRALKELRLNSEEMRALLHEIETTWKETCSAGYSHGIGIIERAFSLSEIAEAQAIGVEIIAQGDDANRVISLDFFRRAPVSGRGGPGEST